LRKALSPPIQLALLPPAGQFPFQMRVAGGPNRACVIETSTNLTQWWPVDTNTTSSAGTIDFTDSQSAASFQRFYRAVAAP
jgi:hypothetical protein